MPYDDPGWLSPGILLEFIPFVGPRLAMQRARSTLAGLRAMCIAYVTHVVLIGIVLVFLPNGHAKPSGIWPLFVLVPYGVGAVMAGTVLKRRTLLRPTGR